MAKKIKIIPSKPKKIEQTAESFDAMMEEDEVVDPEFIDVDELVPMGSTTGHLECSGHWQGAFKLGSMINIIGDSHAGKCVKNSYILTSKGIELIDNIGQNQNEGLSPYVETLTTSKNKKDVTSHFWKEKVTDTIKIITEKGYSIEGTPDHPIMIMTEDFQFKMCKLQNIGKGDCAIIARGTNTFSDTYFPIKNIRILGTNVKYADIPKEVTESFARLLGYIVADGNLISTAVFISNTKQYIRNDLQFIAKELNVHLSKQSIGGKHLSAVISELFGNPKKFTARYKFVPECILKSPKKIQTSFLRALIDCDGYGNETQISYYTASKQLAEQIHLMLLNLGIISTLSFKDGSFDGINYQDHIYWSVNIYGDELILYQELIGSLKYNTSLTRKIPKRNSDYDSIPNLIEKMKGDIDSLRKKVGWSKNGKCLNDPRRFPRIKFANIKNGSKRMIRRFIDLFSDWPIDLSFYHNIESSGYCFDSIKTIEHKKEQTLVYDVHIPNTHLFWSNGFISHNTLLAFTIFAECNKLSRFDNYKFIYDDVEAANEFNLSKLFGQQCANRIDQSIRSKTIEDFNDNVARQLDEGEPFIYVNDSFDALTSEAVIKKDIENRKKREKGNETTGDYGDGKAKIFSRFCSLRIQELKDSNSLLIIISQTRDNIGFGAQFTPKTRSGGRALKFYAAFEMWLACQKKEKKGKRTIVTNVQGKISKNKLTGYHGEFYFPILRDYGIDNLTSCINFLMDEGDWTGTKKSVNTKGFLVGKDSKGKVKHPSIAEIIDYIEKENKETELYQLCKETYDDIMESLKPERKLKY